MARHADAHLAHANDVVDVLVVLLNLDGGKYERAFRVHVDCGSHIGRRQRISAVGLVRFGEHCKPVNAFIIDDGNEYGVIRSMRIAVIGRIMKERVAALECRMELFHGLSHEVRAD